MNFFKDSIGGVIFILEQGLTWLTKSRHSLRVGVRKEANSTLSVGMKCLCKRRAVNIKVALSAPAASLGCLPEGPT